MAAGTRSLDDHTLGGGHRHLPGLVGQPLQCAIGPTQQEPSAGARLAAVQPPGLVGKAFANAVEGTVMSYRAHHPSQTEATAMAACT